MTRILLAAVTLALVPSAHAATLEVIAGGGVGDGNLASAVQLDPQDVVLDATGALLVADGLSQRVRRIDPDTSTVSTVAGNGRRRSYFSFYEPSCGDDGPATAACLAFPYTPGRRIIFDAAGNLFIMEQTQVRRVDAATGIITRVLGDGTSGGCAASPDGGTGPSTCVDNLQSIGLAPNGDLLVLHDDPYTDGTRVRRVDHVTLLVTTVAGRTGCAVVDDGDGGPATDACVTATSLAVTPTGDLLLGGGWSSPSRRLRRVDATTGVITSIARTGPDCVTEPDPLPCIPEGGLAMAVDHDGTILTTGRVYVRRFDPATGAVSIFAGNGAFDSDSDEGFLCGDGGPADAACLNNPTSIAIDAAGNVFIADEGNARARRVDKETHVITSVAGGDYVSCAPGGPPTEACILPQGIGVDADGRVLVTTSQHQLLRLDERAGTLTTLSGTGASGFCGDGGPARDACLAAPADVTVDREGNIFVADTMNLRVRRIDAMSERITTVAGSGGYSNGCTNDGLLATTACLSVVQSVAIDRGDSLLLVDGYAPTGPRRLDPLQGTLQYLALPPCTSSGNDRPRCLRGLSRLAVDASGLVLLADRFDDRIKRLDGHGGMETIAGGGPGIGASHSFGTCGEGGPATAACLELPTGVAADALGNVFIADIERVLRVDAATGRLDGLAGYPASPQDIAVDPDGNLVFTSQTLVYRLRLTEPGLVVRRAEARQVGPRRGPAGIVTRVRGALSPAGSTAGDLLDAAARNGVELAMAHTFAAVEPPFALMRFAAADCRAETGRVRCAQDNARVDLLLDRAAGLAVEARTGALGGGTVTNGALRVRLTIPGDGGGSWQDLIGRDVAGETCRMHGSRLKCRRGT